MRCRQVCRQGQATLRSCSALPFCLPLLSLVLVQQCWGALPLRFAWWAAGAGQGNEGGLDTPAVVQVVVIDCRGLVLGRQAWRSGPVPYPVLCNRQDQPGGDLPKSRPPSAPDAQQWQEQVGAAASAGHGGGPPGLQALLVLTTATTNRLQARMQARSAVRRLPRLVGPPHRSCPPPVTAPASLGMPPFCDPAAYLEVPPRPPPSRTFRKVWACSWRPRIQQGLACLGASLRRAEGLLRVVYTVQV